MYIRSVNYGQKSTYFMLINSTNSSNSSSERPSPFSVRTPCLIFVISLNMLTLHLSSSNISKNFRDFFLMFCVSENTSQRFSVLSRIYRIFLPVTVLTFLDTFSSRNCTHLLGDRFSDCRNLTYRMVNMDWACCPPNSSMRYLRA